MPASDTVGVVFKSIRVEAVVTDKFPDIAVKAVRPAFDGRIYHGAGGSAEFGRVGARLYTEFLQRVRRRLHGLYGAFLQIRRAGVIVHAVERKIILRFEISIRAETIRRRII